MALLVLEVNFLAHVRRSLILRYWQGAARLASEWIRLVPWQMRLRFLIDCIKTGLCRIHVVVENPIAFVLS